jgi:hypothetical protein
MVEIAVMVTLNARSALNMEHHLEDTGIDVSKEAPLEESNQIPAIYAPIRIGTSWTTRKDKKSNAQFGIKI